MSRFRTVATTAAFVAISLGSIGCVAEGDGGPIELKFGHVGEPGSLFAISSWIGST